MPDATERLALCVCTLIAGSISLGPMEWVSAGVLLGSSVILFLLHHWITKRENAFIDLLDRWVPPPGAPPAPPASLSARPAEAADVAAPLET